MSSVPLPPGPVSLPDLVAFQPGAVVSRTLVKTGGGTVTAFAFDAGEALSEHSAPFDALVIGVEGEAEVSISKVPHRVKAGDLLRLPANEPHGLKAVTPFKMILVMVKA
ncbi:MAG TPA: cupin domain-containing protein [Thermoanaerobaculia bacterium]|nr:cupin domain-containing protein [Thermoanaerobaculia bacterium]